MILVKEGLNYSITSECHEPRIPKGFGDLAFKKAVESIVGKKYFVSIAFVRQRKIALFNKKYRGKNLSTDVLSFPLDKYTGEILFSLADIRRKARSYKLEAGSYLPYLLIHALLHLKGLRHSSKMERLEKKFCKVFKIYYPDIKEKNERENNSRNRYRDVPSTSGSFIARK